MNSADGAAKTTYLDRTIAHEFTHAVMSANISCFGKLPLYVKEGTAELTHGIDDERGGVIVDLLTNRRSTLQNVFDTGGSQNGDLFEINAPYAAGYMLMRYLAKQGAGNAIPNIDAAYDKKYKPQRVVGPETATEINFDSSHYEDGTKLKFPTSFDDQGFCILCGACGQYINFTFDKDMAMGTATMKTYPNNYARKDYTIGIGGAKNTADLAKALFEGISKAPGRSTLNDVYVEDSNGNKELVCVSVDPTHNLRIAKNPNYPADSSSEYIFLKDYNPPLLFKEGGIIDATGDENSKDNAPEGSGHSNFGR